MIPKTAAGFTVFPLPDLRSVSARYLLVPCGMIGYHVKGETMAARQRSKRRGTRDDESSVRQRILSAAFAAFKERGYAGTSTREIATRARVSKRALYALVGNKQEMLAAGISERAQRLKAPADLPELRDRETLAQGLAAFGVRLLSEVSDPVVIAVFRL